MSNKRLNATITIGGAVAGSLAAAFGSATSKIGKVGDEIKRLERAQKQALDAVKEHGAFDIWGVHEKRLKRITQELERQRRIGSAKEGMAAGKERMQSAGVGLGLVGAAAAAAAFPIVQAARFETAMLGVAKQVDGARDSSGKLTAVYFDMKKKIQELGREMPMATNDIAAMVTAGARMGIARNELIDFTKTAGMMAEAFELPAGELADQMGKIQKLFGLKTQNEVRALADSVNYLDDNAISKGGDIIDFLQRTGGVAGSVKITGVQMAALGSTLLTLGETSDTAGTSVKAMFVKLGAAEKGTKKFRAAMSQLGLSLTDVQKGMQVDAQGTLIKVLDKVRGLPKDQQIGVLTQIVGLEHAGTLAKLANGIDEYRKQIDLASSQKAEGSMGREFQARLGTTGAQFEIMKNRAGEVAETIGAVFLPRINEMLPKLGDAATGLVKWGSENKLLIGNLGTLATALAGGYAALQIFNGGLGAAQFAFNALKLAMATNPVGVAMVAIGAAATLIYTNWGDIKYFFSELWIGIVSGAKDAFDWLAKKFEWFGETYRNFKVALGFDAAPASASPARALPEVARAAAGRAGANVNNTTNVTMNLTAGPGHDEKAFAKAAIDELNKRQGVARRGSMVDPVGAH